MTELEQPKPVALTEEKKQRQQSTMEDGCVFLLHVGKASWKARLSPQDFGMKELPANFEPGRRKLLPSDALSKIDALEHQARKTLDDFAFELGQDRRSKFRWVHHEKVPICWTLLEQCKAKFFSAVDELITEYDDLKTKMQEAFPEQWDALKLHYIPAERIREKYTFCVDVFEMVFPSGLTVLEQFTLTAADEALLKRNEIIKEGEEEMVKWKEEQQRIWQGICKMQAEAAHNKLATQVEEATKQLRGMVVEVFEKITEKIRVGGKVNMANVNAILRVAEEVARKDSFGTDETFSAKLGEITALMRSGRDFRDDATATAELRKILDDTVQFVQETTEAQAKTAAALYVRRKMTLV